MGYVDITSNQKTENQFNITTKYESMENWKQFFNVCEILLNADKK